MNIVENDSYGFFVDFLLCSVWVTLGTMVSAMTQEEALTILKTGGNVFLTGEPGSGKTHTVNRYVSYLRERGIEPAITASTGIAATHIGGYTIHSWSGIGVRHMLTQYDLDRITSNKRVYNRIHSAPALIIDEVSMLSFRTLEMVEAVCREVRRDERPFGGLQVVFVGDFFQLPPVNAYAEDKYEQRLKLLNANENAGALQFAFVSRVWQKANPLVCYLSEQHRQEDAAFLEFLSAVRTGAVAESHRALLRTRYAASGGKGVAKLYSHNVDVDRINSAELAKLLGSEREFDMESSGPDPIVAALKRGCLSPERLFLKIGARVMFTKNDAATRRFVNGTMGTVTEFCKDTGLPIVKTNGGRTVRAEPMEWNLSDGGRVLARIIQAPLRLAWAITVHKSQGMSLDAAHMDLSECFEYGQGYVALSRVRALAGLSLSGLNSRALEVHPEIRAKDPQFRAASEAARGRFQTMRSQELLALHADFIRACGGKQLIVSLRVSEKKEGNRVAMPFEEIRATHPNAFRRWQSVDDEKLRNDFNKGVSEDELATSFGRKRGGIHARLVKLGLVEDDARTG